MNPISNHYSRSQLLEAIREGLEAMGRPAGAVTVDDLAPVDEFHIGGREATEAFLTPLAFDASLRVLDVGCGLGGAARFVADRFGCHVAGIDLTADFVDAGRELCRWVGLEERIALHVGDALDLPFGDAAFDGAYMMHVGMNVADKRALFAEVRRVLRPGARFGVYDIVRTGDAALSYPVPWASDAAMSHLSDRGGYEKAFSDAGFRLGAVRHRREEALAFYERLRARSAEAQGPPPLGLHLLMGAATKERLGNMIAGLRDRPIAPVEFVVEAR